MNLASPKYQSWDWNQGEAQWGWLRQGRNKPNKALLRNLTWPDLILIKIKVITITFVMKGGGGGSKKMGPSLLGKFRLKRKKFRSTNKGWKSVSFRSRLRELSLELGYLKTQSTYWTILGEQTKHVLTHNRFHTSRMQRGRNRKSISIS